MTLKNCVALLERTTTEGHRDRTRARTFMAVRFGSATGERIDTPGQPMDHPVISIMTRDEAELPDQDRCLNSALLIVFRHGWPRGLRGRRADARLRRSVSTRQSSFHVLA